MSDAPDRPTDVQLRAVVESSPSGLLMIDSKGSIVLVNREIERLFGYSREELLGRAVETLVPERFRDVHPGYRQGFVAEPRARAMGAGRELFGRRKDGTEVPVEIGLNPVVTVDGLFVISSIVDISARSAAESERQALQKQLRQAQKMEAVGRLASGVAHDFNNILSSVVGFAELVRDHPTGPEVAADVEQVLVAARRGKELVERILRFGRRQDVTLRPVDLAQVVTDTTGLLRSMLPASIELRIALDRAPPRILADAGSVQQVLLNLATNASDAMPAGGRIDITAEPFFARDHICRAHPGLREGHYALIRVHDSGLGMDEETLSRALEPFFTTKPPGKGSGLGLFIIHGLVRDHGGALWLDSAPGEGTTVSCLFSVPEAETLDLRAEAARSVPQGRGERVLLVDDEPSLVALGVRRLTRLGYRVESFTEATTALELLRSAPDAFDLLITDSSMPRMSGLELAAAARSVAPALPVIMLTGYSDDLVEQHAALYLRRVLTKPIELAELAIAIRDVLDTRAPAAVAGATADGATPSGTATDPQRGTT